MYKVTNETTPDDYTVKNQRAGYFPEFVIFLNLLSKYAKSGSHMGNPVELQPLSLGILVSPRGTSLEIKRMRSATSGRGWGAYGGRLGIFLTISKTENAFDFSLEKCSRSCASEQGLGILHS